MNGFILESEYFFQGNCKTLFKVIKYQPYSSMDHVISFKIIYNVKLVKRNSVV